MTNVINIASPNWDPMDSYGLLATRLVEHLTRAGMVVNGWGGKVLHPNQSEAVQALLKRPVRASLGGVVLGYPTGVHHYGALINSGPRVAITMFESTKLPPGWTEPLNQCQAVIVPSRWLVDVFRECGVTVPIRVIPLGINEVYQYVRRPARRQPFTFLTIGDRMWRKGWDMTARAFSRAFGTNPSYRLIIKVRAQGLPVKIGQPNIEVLAQDMSEVEMQALYARADAYIFASHGEGFGLPPREAAATGLPVICSDWGGTADDLRLWGFPLRCGTAPAWPGEKFAGLGEWAQPDEDHLVEQMRFVSSGHMLIPIMAKLGARHARRLYDWQRFANGVLAVWREVTEGVRDDHHAAAD